MMERMNRGILLSAALLAACGCASRNSGERGFAGHPQWKGEKSARGSKGEQKPQAPPRILPETHYAAGRVFEQQGSPEKAIEQYRKAVTVNHEYTAAYARLGLMLSITGRHEEAIAAFTRAVELKPTSPILRNNLGFELLYVERWDEAERNLREAARLDAKVAQAHINLGLLLGRTQRDDEAVASFNKVLPEPDSYYNLGLIQRAQRNYAKAADSFRRVLTINPQFVAAQRQLNFVESKISTAPPIEPTTVVDGAAVQDAAKVEPEPDARHVPVQTQVSSITTPSATPTIDLTELINQLFSRTATTDVTPTAPTAPTTTREETVNRTSETAPAPVETTTARQIEYFEDPETPPTRLIEYFEEEAVVPTNKPTVEVPTAVSEPQTRPLRWDLNLAELAYVLNEVDSQSAGLQDVRTLTTQPGPVAAQSMGEEFVGVPAPVSDEVVLVLDAHESRVLDLRGKLKPIGPRAYEQTWKLSRDVETSIQILRNEVECQKDEGTLNRQSAMEGPAFSNPSEPVQSMGPWQTQFMSLDNWLDVVKNESLCTEDVTVAQALPAPSPTTPQTELGSPYQYGPALYTPPPTTPSRNRWGKYEKSATEKSRKRRR